MLVSHGDTLGVLFALWLGLEAEMLNAIPVCRQAGGVSVLQWRRGGKRIVRQIQRYVLSALKCQKKTGVFPRWERQPVFSFPNNPA